MFRRLLAVLTIAATALVIPGSAHAGKTYSGEGDQVVRIRTTKTPGLLTFTHDGEANFIVTAVNPAGKMEDLLVNEIGPYEGTVLYNGNGTSKGIAALEIKADGAWTAVFKPVSAARCWCAATIRGVGDQVLKLSPTRGLRTVRAVHSGEANFIVQSYTRVGTYGDLLFNEIGGYRGKALLPAGTRLVTVKADGSWTLQRR
ncbi:hypothetical protein ACQEVF_58700 [Nonomuraea polychroma]|uniref:hypothetical protein n=1 Tax=Nonomuraea polychroma TaxID=46176 RepID=UPI003D8A45D2